MDTINVADSEVVTYLGSPDRLMTVAGEGHLSKFALASVLESDSRQQFLDSCAVLEKRFTADCPAHGETCLADGCAMDGEVCLQALLKAGASVSARTTNTGVTPLHLGAASGNADVVKLLLDRGADPTIISRDGETMLSAAAGLAFVHGYHRGKSPEERLQVVKLFVAVGNDVNEPDDYGITPLMAAANYGNVAIIQYLIDAGADLGAHDLGKKNDGQFGSSVEPLMPIDYAIGVGTFVPNNAVIIHEEAVALMARLMKERGIAHTTSECTLRGFTCAQAKVDPKVASPAEIMRARKVAIGHQIEGITGGLVVK